MSKLADRVSRLHVGGEAIMKIFAGKSGGGGSAEMGVPVTKHPLERAEKWSVDSYPVEREVGGPILLVTVHGEFEESESTFSSFCFRRLDFRLSSFTRASNSHR